MSKTILLVDDSATMRRATAAHLRGDGYEVIEATDGRDALARLALGFDLLITDINMPQINGLQLIQITRALPQYSHVPIVVLSTETNEDKRLAGRAGGVDCWIAKPIRPALLLAAVRKLFCLKGPAVGSEAK